MKKNELFKKYYKRLRLEGLLKSLIIGLAAGFAAGAAFSIVALVTGMFAVQYRMEYITMSVGLLRALISVGIIFVVLIITVPIVYAIFFKPKSEQVVRRIDALGLEERIVTMMEFEQDQSFMAVAQREDAKAALAKSSPKKMKIAAFMLIPIIVASALAVVFTSTTIATAVNIDTPMGGWTGYSRRPDDPEIEPDPDPLFTYWTIELMAHMGGGYIRGDTFQVIVEGENARRVIAIAFPMFGFVEWSFYFDEGDPRRENPIRQDLDLSYDIVDGALFQLMDEGGDGESD